MNDEWQLEVYLFALGLMKKFGLKSAVDVGCGSGYKLVTYLKRIAFRFLVLSTPARELLYQPAPQCRPSAAMDL